jgi:hypothetical protein
MSDPHQIITIIATAIHDCQKEIAKESVLDPEEAKHMAKCICEALAAAGLQVVEKTA